MSLLFNIHWYSLLNKDWLRVGELRDLLQSQILVILEMKYKNHWVKYLFRLYRNVIYQSIQDNYHEMRSILKERLI